MGTADEDDIEEGGAPTERGGSGADRGVVSDEGGDSDPGASTGESQTAENR